MNSSRTIARLDKCVMNRLAPTLVLQKSVRKVSSCFLNLRLSQVSKRPYRHVSVRPSCIVLARARLFESTPVISSNDRHELMSTAPGSAPDPDTRVPSWHYPRCTTQENCLSRHSIETYSIYKSSLKMSQLFAARLSLILFEKVGCFAVQEATPLPQRVISGIGRLFSAPELDEF